MKMMGPYLERGLENKCIHTQNYTLYTLEKVLLTVSNLSLILSLIIDMKFQSYNNE